MNTPNDLLRRLQVIEREARAIRHELARHFGIDEDEAPTTIADALRQALSQAGPKGATVPELLEAMQQLGRLPASSDPGKAVRTSLIKWSQGPQPLVERVSEGHYRLTKATKKQRGSQGK